MSDLKVVASEAEELGAAGSERLAQARDKLLETLRGARQRISYLEQDVLERGRTAARATDQYVHDNPWKSMTVVAGVGLLIGLLLSTTVRR